MIKKIFILVFAVALASTVKGQEITRNNVYFEIGGASMFYSVNYERLLLKSDQNNLAVRVGLMYLNYFDDKDRAISGVPVSISYLKKLRKNFLEVGVSGSVMYDSYYLSLPIEEPWHIQDLVLMPSIRLGIRHQPKSAGFFWNTLLQYSLTAVGYIKEFNDLEINSFPFLSIGVGYAFN